MSNEMLMRNGPRTSRMERCASPQNHRSSAGEPTVRTAATTYLDGLNPDERRAVEHGVQKKCTVGPPLLVIAGAGSGKTNTPAHRVAPLIVNGADPNRLLLMTFSRRA